MSQAMQNRYAQKEIRTNVLPDIVLTEWDTEIVGVPKKKERVNVVEKMGSSGTRREENSYIYDVSDCSSLCSVRGNCLEICHDFGGRKG